MASAYSILAHIGIGSIALFAYWLALLSRKGAAGHRLAGKICLGTLVIVGLSVGPILFSRPGPFDPGWVVQMLYLVACLFTVSMLAFNAIRFKSEPHRFRSRAFRLLGPVLLLLGFVVLAAGLATGDPIAAILSWVGLLFGPLMIVFARYRGRLHPRWWLAWHLTAVCALFNAVNGTFLYIVFREVGMVPESVISQAAFQILTMAAALVLRLHFGRKYRAPLGFRATPHATAHA